MLIPWFLNCKNIFPVGSSPVSSMCNILQIHDYWDKWIYEWTHGRRVFSGLWTSPTISAGFHIYSIFLLQNKQYIQKHWTTWIQRLGSVTHGLSLIHLSYWDKSYWIWLWEHLSSIFSYLASELFPLIHEFNWVITALNLMTSWSVCIVFCLLAACWRCLGSLFWAVPKTLYIPHHEHQ